MKRPFIIFTLLISAIACSAQLTEEQRKEMEYVLNKPVQHKYQGMDNIFFGASMGLNYSLSEYARKEKVFSMLRPQADFTFGKFFNKWFAARAGIGFMSQEASIPQELQQRYGDFGYEPYNFCMLGIKVDAMFSLNRIFTPYRYDEPFQMWFYGGVDGFRTLGFQKKVKEWSLYPIDHKGTFGGGWHAGLEAQFRTGDHYSVTLAAAWHQAGSNFDGQKLSSGSSRNYVSLSVGFVYRFTNSHGEMGFHNCKHNENYYFDEMNRRIAKYYIKNDITAIGQQDTIITFPTQYSYLTPLQKEKLDKLAMQLSHNTRAHATIDVYSDGNETPVYNEFRAENREESILKYMQKTHPEVIEQISIYKHSEASPIPPQHIWSRAGIIHVSF